MLIDMHERRHAARTVADRGTVHDVGNGAINADILRQHQPAVTPDAPAVPPASARYALAVRYAGEGVPEGAVATTVRFLYASPERSLTQDEVNDRQEALRRVLEDRFGAAAAGPR